MTTGAIIGGIFLVSFGIWDIVSSYRLHQEKPQCKPDYRNPGAMIFIGMACLGFKPAMIVLGARVWFVYSGMFIVFLVGALIYSNFKDK